ncbi:MAG TPA: family 16 glycoside hydrolase, partial [Tepidisphaeraceae bacterium]|nr:family 16 glycoside hydrolase [Tepidisphaeraceae bacterium]
MRFTILLALVAVSVSAVAQEQPALSWRPVFDGKTLAGWRQVGDGEWVVEDGAIVGRTQEKAKLYGLLVSEGVFLDFSVRLKFKSVKGNSGFYPRVVIENPDKAHGLQVEVDPRNNTGGIYESYGRGWVAKPEAAVYAKAFKADEWNAMMVECRGGDVTVRLNGEVTARVKDDPSRPAGQLALQMHAGNEMLVMFKDIEVLAPLKKGPDKKGPTTPAKVEAGKDGSLVLKARHSTLSGATIAFMPEWDALGFWRAGESAEWDVTVAKAGVYDVVMEWSVDPKNAGNAYVLTAGAAGRLEGKVESTGRWDVFRRGTVGQIRLEAGEQKIKL